MSFFGGGAGAILIEPAQDGDVGLIDYCHEVDGSGAPSLNMPAGGSLRPSSSETISARFHYVHQDGQAVYKYAVHKMVETSGKLLKKNDAPLPIWAASSLIRPTGGSFFPPPSD